MRYLGIDPGKKGAIAVIDDDGNASVLSLPFNEAQPDGLELAMWLTEHAPQVRMAAIEYVNSFNMGRQQSFVFGQGWGALRMLLELRGIPRMIVRPQDWQAVTMRGQAKSSEVSVAMGRWPDLPWPRAKDMREGWADALLIAEYARISCK